jgi:hypothetical protein
MAVPSYRSSRTSEGVSTGSHVASDPPAYARRRCHCRRQRKSGARQPDPDVRCGPSEAASRPPGRLKGVSNSQPTIWAKRQLTLTAQNEADTHGLKSEDTYRPSRRQWISEEASHRHLGHFTRNIGA